MKMEQILRYIIIGGLFLLPVIPFIVMNSMFFPFITGKNFFFRILVEIIFGLWIILAIKDSTYRPSFSWIFVAITSFVGIIAIADIFGGNFFKSFWSNFERMEGFVSLIHYLALFVVMGTVLNTKKLWGWLVMTSIGASAIMGIYSILQISGKLVINQGGVRVDGTFGNAAYLAGYMLLHVFITLIFLAKWRGANAVRYVLGVVVLLQSIILFYTATRGAILGLIGALLLSALLIVIFGREYPRMRKGSITVLIGIIIVVSGFLVVKESTFVKENQTLSRLASISLNESNARLTIWPMAYKGFKERPLLGWGQENFNLVFNKYYKPSLYKDEPWFDKAHNIFLDWLVAGGSLGFVAYLSIFFATLYYIWRRQSKVYFSIIEKSLLTALLAGYSFHNLFVFDNVMSYVLFMAVLAYVYSATRGGVKEDSFFAHSVSTTSVNYVAIPAVLLLVVSSVYFLNVPGILTSKNIIYALTASDDLTKRTEFLEKAGSYNSLGSQEVAEQTVQAAFLGVQSNASNGEKTALFTLAERLMLEQIDRAPDDARLHVFLGSFYDQFGQFDKARLEFNRSIELSPLKQRIHIQLGFNYLNSKEYDKALDVFKYAHELDTQFEGPKRQYAAAAIYAGRQDLAEGLINEIKKERELKGQSLIIDDETLLRAYAETGNFLEVFKIWKYRVEQNPSNTNARLSLVATLIQLNRNTEAIDEIQKIISINPDFKSQGEFSIQEIRAGRGKALIQQ